MSCWNGCPGCPDCTPDVPTRKSQSRTAELEKKRKKADGAYAKRQAKRTAALVTVYTEPAALPPAPVLDLAPVAPVVRHSTKLSLNKVLKEFSGWDHKPRAVQVEAIEKSIAAFNRGARYVVLEAPPGVGKSDCGVALARQMGRTYFCTLTEQLQLQYLTQFQHLGMRVLKGRGKYHCDRVNDSCKVGAQALQGKFACLPHACPYQSAKQQAFEADLMMANYHSFLANVGQAAEYEREEANSGKSWEEGEPEPPSVNRPFMVLDEVHIVESFLLDQVGFTVNREKLEVDTPALPNELLSSIPYVEWMKVAIPLVKERMKAIVDPERRDDLRLLVSKMSFAMREATATPLEFIPERGTNNDGSLRGDWFALKPLKVAKYGPWIHGHADRLLLMSATVLNAAMLVDSLGLPRGDGDFVQLGSVFPVANRPIKLYPMNMTKGAREQTWPVMAQMIDRILDHHRAQKGLLLAPSNEMLTFIRKNLSRVNSERLIFAFGEERVERYQEHIRSKSPTVLAASGYWEGADLKEDSSRFQLIPACPRPMWSGQIKARASIDPAWYRWLTYCKIVQGYGRSVRSEVDNAFTYIFDAEFEREMNRPTGSMIPPWVKEAVTVVRPKAED